MGGAGNGTIYRVTPDGALNLLASFANTNGVGPIGGLTLGADGALYGTTFQGGAQCDCGSIFKVTTDGGFHSLASFNGANGSGPAAGLTFGADGALYGTTFAGGASSNGVVFRAGLDGSILRLYSFDITNGAQPETTLLPDADGSFYGTASSGGANLPPGKSTNGVIFKIDANGALTVLAQFNYTNGSVPDGDLVADGAGGFLGVTAGGGSNGAGTVFDVSRTGQLSSLQSFNLTNGGAPAGGLVKGPDGRFYGTTSLGKVTNAINGGGVYRITPQGSFEALPFFAAPEGFAPQSPLVAGSDGQLYGVTDVGDGASSQAATRYNYGAVFSLSTNGALAPVMTFSGTNGADSYAPLTLAGDGNFYGVSYAGGSFGAGAVFRVGNPPFITQQPAGLVDLTGSQMSFSVTAVGGQPLLFQWLRHGQPLQDGGNISGSGASNLCLTSFSATDAAAYSVLISNRYGAVTSAVATLSPPVPGGSIIFGIQTVGNPNQQTNNVTFLAGTNAHYIVQFATNLTTSPWFDLSTNDSTNGFISVTDESATNATRFYRVKN
ncbi:MAG TPA: choice-of-anchor tandem repeat GloVer-containing protein [Verrucomicrobiae bacterium]|jgi:uncharacterized repeat protein (TIGR03803 family)|nr:choice-of-anchor tandem repeat GloVer-containing protein [Verrucomicrobiae bacterium]